MLAIAVLAKARQIVQTSLIKLKEEYTYKANTRRQFAILEEVKGLRIKYNQLAAVKL